MAFKRPLLRGGSLWKGRVWDQSVPTLWLCLFCGQVAILPQLTEATRVLSPLVLSPILWGLLGEWTVCREGGWGKIEWADTRTVCDLQTLLHPFLDFLGNIQSNYFKVLDRIIAFCMRYGGKDGISPSTLVLVAIKGYLWIYILCIPPDLPKKLALRWS